MSFKKLDQEDIVISSEAVTAPLWSNSTLTLTSFYTGSQTAAASGKYYYNVYNYDPALTSSAEVQFSLAYAHEKGSGSALYESAVDGKSPTSAVYGQYRTLVLGDEDSDFTFGSIASEDFFVINVDRARYKEKLLPGSLTLKLTSGSNTIVLTDDSQVRSAVSYVDAGRVYELVSGSQGTLNTSVNSNGYTSVSGSYGKLLPDIGVILLNGRALRTSTATGGLGATVSLFTAADSANLPLIYNLVSDGGSFRLNSEETVTSNFIFVRARNSEFNYSTNPSNITGSGELLHDIMVDTPQAYPTTVGLYNDNNDLVAVAKLSRPLLKDFTREALLRIKLTY